jgi:nucleoside-triphosphatase
VLAHARSRSRVRVGRYGVEPERLEPLVQAELEKPADEVDIFLIDEIGKMELHCPAFVELVPRLLSSPIPVVATVALKGSALIRHVKDREDVRVVQVTNGNRDELPEELEGWLRGRA